MAASLRARVRFEAFALVVRHAEQFADHHRGHGHRELADQVGGPRPGGEGVEAVLHVLGDARFERFHALDGEDAGELAAQPGVVRRVHLDEHARRHGEVALEVEVALQAGHRDRHLRRAAERGAEAGVGQDLAGQAVAGDQPAQAPFGVVPHPPHLGPAVQLHDGGRRVEGVVALEWDAVRRCFLKGCVGC
jgi:hypothetical protein